MKIIKANYEIINEPDWSNVTKQIEDVARTCYQSHDKTVDGSADTLVAALIRRGHEAMLEFADMTVRFTCDRGVSHELVRHRHCSFCLHGDTEVLAFRHPTGRSSKRWTLKQLWNWQNDSKRKGRLKAMRIRSVNNEGQIVSNNIKKVINSGRKELFEVVCTSGRTIKATKDHLFMTCGSWKKLEDLQVGDRLTANGADALENKEWLYLKYITENNTLAEMSNLAGCCVSLVTRALRSHGISKPLTMRKNRQGGGGTKGMHSKKGLAKLREIHKGAKNPAWKGDNITENSGRSRANRNYTPDICWGCNATKKLERHHVDENPKNNSSSNIKFLCQKCRKAFHIGQAVLTVFSDEIESITPCGIHETFDLEMETEPHNFVANGLVVHNSQESTRYVKYNGEMEFIKPCWFSARLSLEQNVWAMQMKASEDSYRVLLEEGWSPQQARSVLPNSLKTVVNMKTNLRDWRHIFSLRCDKSAHPQMRELMIPLFNEVKKKCPVVFDSVVFSE